MGERGRDIEEESLEETNLDGDLAAGVGLVFVWVERRQQRELRGLHAVPVVAVAIHGHLPGAELREHAPTAAGARGRLAVVLVRGGGREEGRRGGQDDQEPRHAGTRGSTFRGCAEPEALSVVGDSESLKVSQVSHTAAAAWRTRRRPSPAWLGPGNFASAGERKELTRLPLCFRVAPWPRGV
jgi:hypothetical protein